MLYERRAPVRSLRIAARRRTEGASDTHRARVFAPPRPHMSGPVRKAEDSREATAVPERAAAPAGAGVLRIAGSPPRVVRLSRKALASIGVVAGLGVGGALI